MSWLSRMRSHCQADQRLVGLLLFGSISLLGILPFAVGRLLDQDWLRAGVDLALMAVIAGCTGWSLRSGRYVTPASLVALSVALGALAVAAISPVDGLFWVYPVVAGNFMLAPRRVAVGCAALVLAGVAALPWLAGHAALPLSFYVTAALVAAFGFISATLTERHRRQLEQLAGRDALTGVRNRRAMEADLAEAVAQQGRTGRAVSLAVLDLDHFKRVNDVHGHEAGDRVLVAFAGIVQDCVRMRDRLYRLGGEEFVLLMPDTDEAGMQAALRKLHGELQRRLRGPGGLVGTSIGAALLQPGEDWSSWLARADAALYRAKRQGRNRIEWSGEAADRRGTPQSACA